MYVKLFLISFCCIPILCFSQEMSQWDVVYNEDGKVLNKIDFFDDQFAVAVGNEGLVLLTTDGGTNWDDYSDSKMADLTSIDVISKTLVFASSEHDVFRSLNGGKDWTNVFSDNSVTINQVCKTYLYGSDGVFICCNNGLLFASLSNGDKWYRKDLKGKVSGTDDIFYGVGGKFDDIKDSLYQFVSKDIGFAVTEDNFGSLIDEEDYLEGDDIKAFYEQYDFSNTRFGSDRLFFGESNKVALKGGGSPRTLIDGGAQEINGALMLRHLLGDEWYGYAVGDNGYIAEAVAKTFGNFKKVTALTGNDLNWIDWGADPDHTGGYSTATICAVGDGVILQKRWGWGPVSSPRISYVIHTEVYPNPFATYFKIESKGWDQNERVQARLYDINGVLIKELYNGVLPEGELQLEVVEELPQGVYFMELSSGSKREVKRLVKS